MYTRGVCSLKFFGLIWIFISTNVGGVFCDVEEYRLYKKLLSSYDPGVRPVADHNGPLPVEFGVSLHQIIDVDEKNQILTTNCWLTQVWVDHHLRWNTSEFSNITVIRIPYNRVWRPDIILYNNADPQYPSSVINTNVIVKSDGEVTWLSHGIYRSSCNINVEYFPFDIQVCTLKWASWTYDGFQLTLNKQSEDGDVSNYQPHGEFDLIRFIPTKNTVYYSCCPNEPYPDITYAIILRRRPLFYVFNLILPCILINGIALLVFYVPSESGEKVTLGISALLSMTVFLMTIRETLPPTEKTPLISMYYGVSICLVSFASALSVVTLNVYHRGVGGSSVPPIIKDIVLGKMAKVMFIRFDGNYDKDKPQVNPRTGSRLEGDGSRIDIDGIGAPDVSPKFVLRSGSNFESSITSERCGGEWCCARGIRRLADAAEKAEKRRAAAERRSKAALDWRHVALVLDRALLAAFLLATTLATAAILCGSHPPADTVDRVSQTH